jgi:transcriptional regulator with XRE-family HTH domain
MARRIAGIRGRRYVSKLAKIRQSRNLSMAALARMLTPPTSATQILRLEVGERKLTAKWVNRLATALGVSPYDLYEDSDLIVSSRERELIETLRRLPPDQQAVIYTTAKVIAGVDSDPPEDEPN